MPATCCPFVKPDGAPCAARPLPNSAFCLFHDPAHQQALAESRSKGGSTPRRRLRRFPRLLDHVHVAELLGELFVDSLNNPDAIDTKRLQALTALSRALLKAVGTPPTFLVHSDRREPAPAAGHLLRVYPPLPPEIEALLEAEPPADSDTQPPPPAGSPLQELDTVDAGDGAAWNAAAEFLPRKEPPAPVSAPAPHVPNRTNSVARSPEALAAAGAASSGGTPEGLPEGEQGTEQVNSRQRTGPSPTDKYWAHLLASLPPTASVGQPATEVREAAADQPALDAVPPAPAAATDPAPPPDHLNTRTPECPTAEQDLNRSGTGLPGTNGSQPGEPTRGLQSPAADCPAPPGGTSLGGLPSRPRAGWLAHSPPPTRTVT